jgi:hypothetical protein
MSEAEPILQTNIARYLLDLQAQLIAVFDSKDVRADDICRLAFLSLQG